MDCRSGDCSPLWRQTISHSQAFNSLYATRSANEELRTANKNIGREKRIRWALVFLWHVASVRRNHNRCVCVRLCSIFASSRLAVGRMQNVFYYIFNCGRVNLSLHGFKCSAIVRCVPSESLERMVHGLWQHWTLRTCSLPIKRISDFLVSRQTVRNTLKLCEKSPSTFYYV